MMMVVVVFASAVSTEKKKGTEILCQSFWLHQHLPQWYIQVMGAKCLIPCVAMATWNTCE